MNNSRVYIKDYILNLEKEFPVNDWQINSIHIWPYIRIKLFFYLINKIENKQSDPPKNKEELKYSKLRVLLYHLKQLLIKFPKDYFFYKRWLNKLPEKDFMFLGSDTHRVDFKNKRYNRYFDTWIGEYNLSEKSLFLENDRISKKNQYNKENVFKFKSALKPHIFLKKINLISTRYFLNGNNYEKFINYLKESNITKDFSDKYNKVKLENWFTNSFQIKIDFFIKVLKTIKPKKIFLLCFYDTEEMFAIIVAANKLKIKTIEMQHGSLGELHLSYGSWSKMPKEGYSIFPTTFLSWDKHSKNIIDDWSKNIISHNCILTGNPWIDYWNKKSSKYKHNDFILYSLQPINDNFNKTFPDNLIQVIIESKYKWFIRLHPREINSISSIIHFFKTKKISKKVNLLDATRDPLPILIKNAKLHVTFSSGCTIEASLMNVKTVLLGIVGNNYYSDLIKQGKAIYLDINHSNFEKLFTNQLNSKANRYILEKNVYDNSFLFDKTF